MQLTMSSVYFLVAEGVKTCLQFKLTGKQSHQRLNEVQERRDSISTDGGNFNQDQP